MGCWMLFFCCVFLGHFSLERQWLLSAMKDLIPGYSQIHMSILEHGMFSLSSEIYSMTSVLVYQILERSIQTKYDN